MDIDSGMVGRMPLYQFRKGTNPRRFIIYLSDKGIDVTRYELDGPNGEHRSTRYLAVNPSGRVPALVTDDGIAIADSGAIIEYLEELHPGRPMIGTDAVSRARVHPLERLGSDLVARGVEDEHGEHRFHGRNPNLEPATLRLSPLVPADPDHAIAEHPSST